MVCPCIVPGVVPEVGLSVDSPEVSSVDSPVISLVTSCVVYVLNALAVVIINGWVVMLSKCETVLDPVDSNVDAVEIVSVVKIKLTVSVVCSVVVWT